MRDGVYGIGFYVPCMGRRGRLCSSRGGWGGGSVLWQTIQSVRDGVGQIDTRWLLDNITRQVGDYNFKN